MVQIWDPQLLLGTGHRQALLKWSQLQGVAAPWLLWQQHVTFGRVLSQRQLLAWGKGLVPPARLF